MKSKAHKTLFIIGWVLLIDGILSLYFGHACLSSCYNNSGIGDLVRIFRGLIGGYLIYEFY